MQTLQWRKSTYSGDSSNCVEIATTPTTILVRDSKNPAGPRLAFLPATWVVFTSSVAETRPRSRGESFQ
ncbi:DUF397 domain-containing protein [Streptomyces cyaneogriseus]|uniref:DUF397 domain-containing protein n=1 Tax=Streptomyces cyaneogriseus TaxID=68192 RepID=UPI00099DC1E2|nr:DUF397 domain-containing protein [Streptomyces cyaneogriseus]